MSKVNNLKKNEFVAKVIKLGTSFAIVIPSEIVKRMSINETKHLRVEVKGVLIPFFKEDNGENDG